MSNFLSFFLSFFFKIFLPINTLVGKSKLIKLSAKPLFPTEPITYKILEDIPVDVQFIQISNDTIQYTSSALGVIAVSYEATQINPSTKEIVVIDSKVILFANINQAYIDAIPKTLVTYTFDTISFDGDTWKLGTMRSNDALLPITLGDINDGGYGIYIRKLSICYRRTFTS